MTWTLAKRSSSVEERRVPDMTPDGILYADLNAYYGREVLSKYHGLRAIATATTGTTHIDLEYCRERGLEVISIAGAPELHDITATAELTIGLILALVRKIPVAAEHVLAGGWDRQRFVGRELSGMRLAIIGCGRIGQMVERFATAMWMHTLSVDHGHRLNDLKFAIMNSDIVTLHASYHGQQVFGRDHFAQMKPGSYFINTARGELVDEDALLSSLLDDRLAGAALDVLANEQRQPNRKLLDYAAKHPDRLIITPHIGGCCIESQAKAERILERRVQEWRQRNGLRTSIQTVAGSEDNGC